MKISSLLVTAFLLLCSVSYSQTDTDTTLKPGWNQRGVIGLGLNQVALSNWVQGGENIISLSGSIDFGLFKLGKQTVWSNRLIANLGSTKTGSGNFQTNENNLVLENILSWKVGWAVNPFISNSIRTPVLNGYDYSKDPSEQTAAFFDPGYVTQSIGLAYGTKVINTRLGLAFQETFTNRFRQYTDDPETADEREAFRFETGLESVTEANYGFAENMSYISRLRLFSAFDRFDTWDIAWDNSIVAKVNDFLSVNLNAVVFFDKVQSPKTQFKEGIQVGITYAVF
ncbi:MAG: DUF3078 domain-containing protein [Ignavibacteria bacterium]|nr:DUF3078 domain-containing protein [Ignavibacteria bacterium]